MAIGSVSAVAAATAPTGPRVAFTQLGWQAGLSLRTVGVSAPRAFTLYGDSDNDFVIPQPFSNVSWSPDGTWLYFGGLKRMRRAIYKVRSDGTGLRRVRGTAGGTNPAVSADGTQVAFTRIRPARFPFRSSHSLWISASDGGRGRLLMPWRKRIEYIPTSFAPDSTELALTRHDLATDMATVMLVATDGARRLRRLARPASDAVFSPDGSRIAFVRHTLSTRGIRFTVDQDLYVMNADGSSRTQLTRTPRIAETSPSWDPLGERLAFNAYRNSKDFLEAIFNELFPMGNSIVEVNADGTCRHMVLRIKRSALRSAAWQPGPGRAAGRIEC